MPNFFTKSDADRRKEGISLQKEYAEKRGRVLNKRDDNKIKLVTETIERLAKKHNASLDQLARNGKEGWTVVYDLIANELRSSDLTINLEAESWFGKDEENTYQTYATTYQKNMDKSSGKAVLKTQRDLTGKITEDADSRMYADERVTIPDKWKDASLLHFQRRRLYKKMSVTKGKDINDLKKVDLKDNQDGIEVENRHFNPHAKQVFAALNYAKRTHGSSVNYGYSHIILKPELKRKAIYFPSDTFSVCIAQNAVSQQATYETLGAILAYCDGGMAEQIWQTCFGKQRGADTKEPFLLLESHIFDEVKINKDIEMLKLSRRLKNDQTLDGEKWAKVRRNAYAWGEKNNVRVFVMSA